MRLKGRRTLPISRNLRRNLSLDNPRLIVDIPRIFGKPIIEDPLRQVIGQSIIDRIVERAESANFLRTRGDAFRYTPEYVNSIEFRAFGKSQGRVNLTASGDMLRGMDIMDSRPRRITIGFPIELQGRKAHGHITGSVGKQRDFFGLTDSDLMSIRREFQTDIDESGRLFASTEQRAPGENNLEFLIRIAAGFSDFGQN